MAQIFFSHTFLVLCGKHCSLKKFKITSKLPEFMERNTMRTTHLAQSHYPAVVGKSGLTELYLTLVFQPWHSALLRSEGQSFGRFIFLTRVLVGRYFSVN